MPERDLLPMLLADRPLLDAGPATATRERAAADVG
jgi:hypothetical protein